MTRHSLSPLLAIGALTLLPLLTGCSCSDQGVSGLGDVDEEEADKGHPFSSDWGQWLSSTKLADGTVGIAYYDRDQGGIGFGIGTPTADGLVWEHEQVDGYPQDNGLDAGDRGMYTAVATDPDGTVWAAFYDIGAHNLRYGKRVDGPSGIVWKNNIADVGEGLSQDAGLFASIAIGGNGKPIVSHYDKGAQTLRVAHWSGGSFTGEVVDRGEDRLPEDTGEELIEANVGMYSRIRYANGQEYIAYYDQANGDLKLAVGRSGDYQIHIIDEDGDVGAWPDMVIRGKTVHLAYQDVGKQHLLYAVGKPGEDFEVTVVDRSDLVGADTALYFDGGKPRIVYFDGYNNNMKLAKLKSGSWQKSSVRRKGAVGFHNEVVTAGGKTYAACFNYTKRDVFLTTLD
jgi:hypothetical protein